MSRVHVSSRSGGWRIDGFAGPQPNWGGREGAREGWREGGGRRGRRIETKGGGEMRERRDSVLRANRKGAGWLSLHVRGSLSSCREELSLQNKGWVLCSGVIGHLRLDVTSLNKGLFMYNICFYGTH